MDRDSDYIFVKSTFKFLVATFGSFILLGFFVYLGDLHESLELNSDLNVPFEEYQEDVNYGTMSIPDPEPVGNPAGEGIEPENLIDLQLSFDGELILGADEIIAIDRNNGNSYMLNIPNEISSLDYQPGVSMENGTIVVNLRFSEFDPKISLQDNVNVYATTASILYFPHDVIQPKIPEKINDEPLL